MALITTLSAGQSPWPVEKIVHKTTSVLVVLVILGPGECSPLFSAIVKHAFELIVLSLFNALPVL